MKRVPVVAVMLWGVSGTVSGGPPADCMDSCAVLNEDAARLACFDRELVRRKAPPADNVSTLTCNAPSQAAAVVRPPHPQPITSQVVAVARASDGTFTITLANGQVWEQTDAREGFRVLLHHGVTIAPSLFGSFLLTTDSHQTVRVRQIH